jgi:predicted PurR-regulated permease PerM
MTSKESFYARVVALLVAAALGYALFLIFAPFAGELCWAAFLAFLLHPLNLRLRRRLKGRASAASLLTVLVPLAVLLPFSVLSISFVSQIRGLSAKLQAAVSDADLHSVSDLQNLSWFASLDRWLADNFSISAQTIQGWLVTGTHAILEHAAGAGGSVFLGTVNSLFGLGLTLVLLYFFLCDGDTMLGRARTLIPLHEARTERLFSGLSSIARAIVFGTTLTAVLQGVLLGLGWRIVGLPSPVVFGVLGALISMLPFGGTALLWIPATAWLFLDHHPGLGTVMAIWGIVLAGLDNVLKPMLISGRATVSPLVVFLGVLGGLSAFGAIGMVAGPILVSLAIALLEFAEEERGRAAVQSAP